MNPIKLLATIHIGLSLFRSPTEISLREARTGGQEQSRFITVRSSAMEW